jgi:hypothetical protein
MPSKKKGARARKLTLQQEAFCQHYAKHRNGAEAYRCAYPKAKKWPPQQVAVEAQKCLSNPKIASRITKLSAKIAEIAEKKFEISAEKIIQELAAIAFANADDYFEWGVVERPVFDKSGNPVIGDDILAISPPWDRPTYNPSKRELSWANGVQLKEIRSFVTVKPSSSLEERLADGFRQDG